MSRKTPSNTIWDPSDSSSQDAVAPVLSRRRSMLPTEPMVTPGRPTNFVTRAARGGGQFARDVFPYTSSDTQFRTTAYPMTNSQQVFVNGNIVLSGQYETAPCYFDPEDQSLLHLRGTFPAQDGDYVTIRYVTAPGVS
jgi:hypothetical protein